MPWHYQDHKYYAGRLGTYQMPDGHVQFENAYQSTYTSPMLVEWETYSEIRGNSGNNTIYGNGSDGPDNQGERIYGNDGNDVLVGRDGDDTLYGGNDNDVLYGGDGTDTLYGGNGHDVLFTGDLRGNQSDRLYGDAGTDTFFLGEVDNGNTVTTSDGVDWASMGLSVAAGLGFLGGSVASLAENASPWVTGIGPSLFSLGTSVISNLLGFRKETVATPPASASYATVEDFNPLEDVIIVPLQPNGNLNVDLVTDTIVGDMALKYIDNNGTDYFASIELDLSDLPGAGSETQATESITKTLSQTALILGYENGQTTAQMGIDEFLDLSGNNQVDTSDLGTNKFLVLGAYGPQQIVGSQNADHLYGTNHTDLMYGYAMNQLGSTPRPDLDTHDQLYGFGGDDVIFGGGGHDIIDGGRGDDELFGGSGNDTLDGGWGYDIIDGGDGIDSTTYAFFWGSINANLESGVVSFPGNSTLTDTLVSIENLEGAGGWDIITGNSADNILNGGYGNDTLTGGSGNDTFVFDITPSTGHVDVIEDFVVGQDTIALDSNAFGNLSNGSISQTGDTISYHGTPFVEMGNDVFVPWSSFEVI